MFVLTLRYQNFFAQLLRPFPLRPHLTTKITNHTYAFICLYCQIDSGKRCSVRVTHMSNEGSNTPHYLINVRVRLLIFEQNSTQHVLIPYHTFINFGKLFQSSLKNEQKPQFLIVSIENVHIFS